MGGILQGNPTQSINSSKREPYPKWASNPRGEEKEEHTPEAPKGDHHSPSSDDSLSPQRNKQISDHSLQGEFQKIRALTYEGEVKTGEKAEEWLLGMSKYIQFHNYSSEMKAQLAIYNLNGKEARWWRDLKNTKKDKMREIRWHTFRKVL